MLSTEQLTDIERLAFRERFVPPMLDHLAAENLLHDGGKEKAAELADLHIGLGRLFIYSPRNTFRFHRFALLRPRLDEVDNRFFYRVIANTGIEETNRLDLIERHLLREDNRARWLDLA